jgi:hypothetical protein
MNAALMNAQDGETVRIPRKACQLRQDIDEAQLELGKGGEPRSFSMVALTGKPLAHWWFGTLGIDLSGVRMKQRLPVLKDHDTEQRLGYTTSMRVDAGRGLIAEGKLMAKSEAAQAVLADHAEGFPWQASTYLQANRIQRLGLNEEAELNGRLVKGPATIFRESTLREVTFTALGVDDDTTATPLAGNGADDDVVALLSVTPMTTKTNEAPAATVAAAAPAVLAASPAQDNTAALAEREKQERARATAILSSAADAQRELAAKLVADGVPLSDALLQLNHDLRVRLSEAHAKANTSAASLAKGNTANVTNSDPEAARLAAMPEGDEKWKAQFAASAALRDEFLGDVSLYVSFKKNEGRARLAHSRKEAEAV